MSEETTSSANDVNEKTSKRKYEEVVPTSKKEKKPPMPCYGKYNILKMLKENHCLFPDEDQLSNAFARYKRYSLDEIKRKSTLRQIAKARKVLTRNSICSQNS